MNKIILIVLIGVICFAGLDTRTEWIYTCDSCEAVSEGFDSAKGWLEVMDPGGTYSDRLWFCSCECVCDYFEGGKDRTGLTIPEFKEQLTLDLLSNRQGMERLLKIAWFIFDPPVTSRVCGMRPR